MKTEFTDVSETQKTHHDRDPDRRGRRGNRPHRARLHEAGAAAGLPPRQGAADDRQAALQRADPSRRDARPDSAGRRRGAAGARHRAGRHAEHQGRRARGRAAAEVHGGGRDRAVVRSRRPVVHHAAPVIGRDHRRRRRTTRCSGCASGPASSSRSKVVRSPTATPWSRISIATGPDGKIDHHDDITLAARRARQPARLRRAT